MRFNTKKHARRNVGYQHFLVQVFFVCIKFKSLKNFNKNYYTFSILGVSWDFKIQKNAKNSIDAKKIQLMQKNSENAGNSS
jgi:hypothetical protein